MRPEEGPLAGPVFAAAVVLGERGRAIIGINDSKKLSEKKRDALALEIKQHATAWAIAEATIQEIDTLNILQAALLAMFRAVSQLPAGLVKHVVVDGTQLSGALRDWAAANGIGLIAQARADADVLEVGAASILAKTARDALMIAEAARYPAYGFEKHKGYGSAVHMQALKLHGPCAIHRNSFAPVREALARLSAKAL